MKRYVMIFCFLISSLPAFVNAETPLDMARDARSAYQEKNYQQAVQKWQELTHLGFTNSKIYFNLSRAYWEMGQPGNALRYLMMGHRWQPRDADIYNNLRYVQEKLEPTPGGIGRWKLFLKENILRPLTLNYYESFFLLALFSGLFFGLLIRGHLKRKPNKKKWLIPIGLFWVLALLFWSQSYYQFFIHKIGVIISTDTPLLSAPTLEAPTGKNLREGQVVRVEKKQGEFQLVKTPSGEGGWVEASFLGIVE